MRSQTREGGEKGKIGKNVALQDLTPSPQT